jgi:hypothetical protein
MHLAAVMVTCPERAADCAATTADLAQTDLGVYPELVVDDGHGPPSLARLERTWLRALERAASIRRVDLVLLLEDDVRFCHCLRHNIESWRPVKERGEQFFASLYHNAGFYRAAAHGPARDHYLVAIPKFATGSQALLIAPMTLSWILRQWATVTGNPDERMPVLAAQVTRVYMHVPSLVQHVGVTTWPLLPSSPQGASGPMPQHQAPDFDPHFRAGGPTWTTTTR